MADIGNLHTDDKVCSCFGHRSFEISDALRQSVRDAIVAAINDGVKVFLFGGLSDFDDLVYDIVSDLKRERGNDEIKRIFCFPLEHDLHKPPHWFEKKEYEQFICPAKSFEYWYTSIYYRNCAMVDMSDVVLFFAEKDEHSGAYKTLEYASKTHKKLINFAK